MTTQNIPKELKDFMTIHSNEDGNLTFTAEDLHAYVVEHSNTMVKTAGAKKAKKNPDMPVKPKTARGLFFEDARDEVKSTLKGDSDSDDDDDTTHPTGREVISALSAAWKALSEDETSGFKTHAALTKNQWETDMEAWYTENPEERPEKKERTARPGTNKFDATQDPDVPEGWTKQKGYLKGTPVDPETGKGKTINFSSFDDAVSKANELGDACGGITMTLRGFSLRRGGVVAGEDFSKNEISWMKSSSPPKEVEVEDCLLPTKSPMLAKRSGKPVKTKTRTD
jgi:hypothetical protein